MDDRYIAMTQSEFDEFVKYRQASRQTVRLLNEAITSADSTVSARDIATTVRLLDSIARLDRMSVVAAARAQGLTEIERQREDHRRVAQGVRMSVAADDALWSIERLIHVQSLAGQFYHELWNPARLKQSIVSAANEARVHLDDSSKPRHC